MINQLLFLTDDQRKELSEIYRKLEKIHEEINCEYEEFAAIKSSLWCINNAINYKQNNF